MPTPARKPSGTEVSEEPSPREDAVEQHHVLETPTIEVVDTDAQDGGGANMEAPEGDEEMYAEQREQEGGSAGGMSGHEEGSEFDEGEDEGYLPQEFAGNAASNNGVNTSTFEEFKLDATQSDALGEVWRLFISQLGSREAAGLTIYTALFESAPTLQALFTSPKAVAAAKFFEGLNSFITTLDNPAALKVMVETLCFGHMSYDVTVPRVVMFRDAINDMFQVEIGDRYSSPAHKAMTLLLNYIGGAMIFIKAHYGERLRLLESSWELANDHKTNGDKFATLGSKEVEEKKDDPVKKPGKGEVANVLGKDKKKDDKNDQNVPTTFPEMFLFNAAVMGFGGAMWMNEVLQCFDNIVRNASNPTRFGEECEVLVLRISNVAKKVVLADFKSCMLASLRSLLPKEWSTEHEVAWCWLWENVERALLAVMGKPPTWQKAWNNFLRGLTESTAYEFRANIYAKFFVLCPTGQDYFKQSTTYLHLMAIKIMGMTLDMFRQPAQMTDDISALGLRHVGYGIPTEYFGPWVTSWLDVVQGFTEDAITIEALRWSMGLITKSLVRTIIEGSTIVMKAINVNTKKAMYNAVSVAPRGERAAVCLMVQVGTQNISPLAWALESGSLDAASAIINDLLTIRADRERYYFGAEELFKRHPDIVKMICDNAPGMLPQLFDGLIWRSRNTVNGVRRVNYYLKHLLVGSEGKFHSTLQWVAALKDPKIVCHPLLVLLVDMTWSRVASMSFLFKKSWFLFTLAVFLMGQSILEKSPFLPKKEHYIAIFACRCFIYFCTLGSMLYTNLAAMCRSYRRKDIFKVIGRFYLPSYLQNWQDVAGLALLAFLIIMLATEPTLWCLTSDYDDEMFTQDCDEVRRIRKFPYSTFSMLAMYLYFILLIDLAVFSTRFSAYVLACGRMLAEVALFLLAAFACIMTYSCGFSALHQDMKEFHGIQHGAVALWELTLGTWTDDMYGDMQEEVVIKFGCYCFKVVVNVFLINMLIAQLSCSYGSTYTDMVGFARLKRIKLIIETMTTVSENRWGRFLSGLNFGSKLEFNEGDLGLAGGVQTTEPASAHPTSSDTIQRFGGTTSPTMSWPASANLAGEDDADKFDKLEKMLQKTMAALVACNQSTSKGAAEEDDDNYSNDNVQMKEDADDD